MLHLLCHLIALLFSGTLYPVVTAAILQALAWMKIL